MSAPPERIRQEVFYSGRVQGVGFRYTTNRIAADFRVTGSVRNLPDGRVHLVAEGSPEEIARFLLSVEERMGDFIRQADKSLKSAATGEFKSFGVRF